jgi:2-dehydro-3-deoxyphosphogluconate aldolase / (4S)-4-hydroxy-2-oxoglutarate aldolase
LQEGENSMEELIKGIEEEKIIAIIRGVEENKIGYLFEALIEGGVKFAEVTLNTKGALKSIEKMNLKYGSNMTIGAGTVLDEKMAEGAIGAGAKFLVSPNVDAGMITKALSHKVLPIPGALTPTEIVQALRYGAPMVKLFPAGTFGTSYIKEVKAPLDDVKLVAVGGINLNNAAEYVKNGACAVGVGGSLIDKAAVERNDFKAISNYAKKLINLLKG